jgi:hypothetical protein
MFVKRKVLHVDGKTTVTAKGLIKDGVFTGEYRYDNFDWGIEIPAEPKYVEKRLDEIKLNDIILNDKKEEMVVGYINPCHNKTWYSMTLSGGEKLEQVLGHNYQTVMVKKVENPTKC